MIAALRGTGVPVPEALVLCEDPERRRDALLRDALRARAGAARARPPEPRARGAPGALGRRRLRAGPPAPGGLAGGGPRRLREAGQLLRAADPPLGGAVPGLRDRAHPGDGAPHRVAARSTCRPTTPRRSSTGTSGSGTRSSTRRRPASWPCWTGSSRRSAIPLGDLGYLCTAFRMPRGDRRFSRPGPDGARDPVGGGGRGALLSPDRSRRDSRLGVLRGLRALPAGRDLPGDHGPGARRHGERSRRAPARGARAPLADAAWAVVEPAA